MSKIQQEKQDRVQKLENLKEQGINPYPAKAKRTFIIAEILKKFDSLKEEVSVDGRLMSKRGHGKLCFCALKDESGQIQIVFQQDELGKENYKNLKNIDVADFIEVQGKSFITQKGEKSILVKNYRILSKTLQPLPDKWHGIKDEESKYRKRYLDILLNPDLKQMFLRKSIFWRSLRDFLMSQNFTEVETPVLESTPGGADAEAFTTHHNALDIDLYLRISMGELWQKRLMVAGFEKTFEIGRQFRNEGIDPEHLQDYTQMEFYMAYANYEDGMKLVEEMYKYVIKKTFNTLQFKIKEFDIDFDKKWEHIDYVSAIKEKLDIDVLAATEDDLKNKIKELELKIEDKIGRGRLIDTLWKQVRKSVAGPAFLINHPVEVSPLAKRKEDRPELVERFQVIIAGSEIGNGYSELNDPIDQKARFEEQAKLREAGDGEAQMHDRDFVEALEHGMPPTCGFGVSERLFSFLENKPIRECVLFPLLRPQYSQKILKSNKDTNQTEFNIPREKSWELLKAHIKNEVNLNHAREAEVILRALARKLGENEEMWGAAGLLHDLDWEQTENTDDTQHGLKTAEYLQEAEYPKEMIHAIKAHNFECNQDSKPESKLDYAVRCGEMITGLIYATALVRPDKKIESVKVKSIKKKMKDKAFAAKVRREIIKESEKLDLELSEFIEISLNAMQEIADEIGL